MRRMRNLIYMYGPRWEREPSQYIGGKKYLSSPFIAET